MRWSCGPVVIAGVTAWVVGGPLCGSVVAEPRVAGFERFGRAATTDGERIEAGLLLVGELGCTSCHTPSSAAAAHLIPKPAPRLDRAGERLDPHWVEAYLRDPGAAHPGTTMPQALAGLDGATRDATVEALVHHLAASGPFDRRMPDGGGANVGTGVAIYRQSGCQVCHGERFAAEPLADQRALVDLAAKWSPRALERFLDDPHQTRPGGRMPALGLSADERRHLVAALLADRRLWLGGKSRRVAFRGQAWHRGVKQLPDVESLGAPDRAGPVEGLEVEAFADRHDDFVVRLEGWLHVPVAGEHRFHLASDDGSRLVVGDTAVVTVDGVHPREEREGSVTLAAGVHPLRLDFFEAGGGCELELEITPPGGLRQPALPFIVPQRDDPPPPGAVAAPVAPAFVVDPTRAAAGREAFAAHGCAACHGGAAVGHGGAAAPPPPAAAPPLAALAAGTAAGCIAPVPAPGRPFYPLDDAQREALRAALAWLERPAAAAAAPRETQIGRTLVALNCLACHPRGGRGGVLPAAGAVDEDGEPLLRDAARDRLFTGPLPEMGDEGRLPPTLDGVGAKLRPEFLRTVLVEGGGDRRATMHTRMPRWPAELAGPLADRLAADPPTVVAVPTLSGHGEPEIVDAARELVGSKGLGCIKCHAFGGDRGQGLGAIDMTRFDDRLRHEWFLAYVADPQAFRPGTRMPASWPAGKVFFPALVGGSAADQIEAVWRYVGGAAPRPPLGLGNDPIELVADDRPVIYRNFITGGGPRGIAVGYPEKVNLTWDAEAFRLALAWRDAFIDARRHWSGRGEGFQPPLGQGVIVPDSAAAVAVLGEPSAAWPAEPPRARGGRFRGYVLDAAGRPEFRWTLGDLEVREAFVPAAGTAPRLVRRITLTGLPAAGQVVFRPVAARRVEPMADGRVRIDDAWTCAVRGDVGPAERVERDGKIELRHPVVPRADAGGRPTAVIEEEIGW